MAAGRAAMISAPATVRVEQVKLLLVTGQLDDAGLARLQRRFDELLDDGALLLLADLSGVPAATAGCSTFSPGPSTSSGTAGAGCDWSGWGPPVLAALDQADLPEVLLVYRSARWTDHGVDAEPAPTRVRSIRRIPPPPARRR